MHANIGTGSLTNVSSSRNRRETSKAPDRYASAAGVHIGKVLVQIRPDCTAPRPTNQEVEQNPGSSGPQTVAKFTPSNPTSQARSSSPGAPGPTKFIPDPKMDPSTGLPLSPTPALPSMGYVTAMGETCDGHISGQTGPGKTGRLSSGDVGSIPADILKSKRANIFATFSTSAPMNSSATHTSNVEGRSGQNGRLSDDAQGEDDISSSGPGWHAPLVVKPSWACRWVTVSALVVLVMLPTTNWK